LLQANANLITHIKQLFIPPITGIAYQTTICLLEYFTLFIRYALYDLIGRLTSHSLRRAVVSIDVLLEGFYPNGFASKHKIMPYHVFKSPIKSFNQSLGLWFACLGINLNDLRLSGGEEIPELVVDKFATVIALEHFGLHGHPLEHLFECI